MNKLSIEKRTQILQMMVEGMSMRGITRTADVSINTVSKILVDAGEVCSKIHHEMVRDLDCTRVECDEIWSFVYRKNKNKGKSRSKEDGDAWTWTSICPDTKLICNWVVGKRTADYAVALMQDLRWRLKNRVQLTTDGFTAYLDAVDDAFGLDVDYAQLVKMYGGASQRYLGSQRTPVMGKPDLKLISTSMVERQNLTMRMSMRRFTRQTSGFSKKLLNHEHALSLYFVHYNFCRIHGSLRVTPAMQAGITDRVWDMAEISEMIGGKYIPQKRGPYRRAA